MIEYENVYTADNEEPDCGRCDNVCCESDYPCKHCGPDYGWAYYKRSETILVSEEAIEKFRKLVGR